MLSIILSLAISSPTVLADRAGIKVDGKECTIKSINYDGVNNYIHTVGNCQELYDKCTEDFCRIKKIEFKDLNFEGKRIGKNNERSRIR